MRHEGLCVYLTLPAIGGMVHREVAAAAYREHGADCPLVWSDRLSTSLLAETFNLEWANALALAKRDKVTHFAMLHADVIPEPGWLGTLIDEAERHKAQVLSALVRIKKEGGDFSTAVSRDPWHVRKLTLQEMFAAPETFSAKDVCRDGEVLLVNTGCMVVDLRGGWAHQTDEHGQLKTFFTIRDRVEEVEPGKYFVATQPEDWNFSRMASAAGAKVMATSKVKTHHRGLKDFGSRMR